MGPEDFFKDIDLDQMSEDIDRPELNPELDMTWGRTDFDDDIEIDDGEFDDE